MNLIRKSIWCVLLGFVLTCQAQETLSLDVISYDAFVSEDQEAIAVLRKALYEKGIVGVRGIPGYREKVQQFIEKSREFSALPESVKEAYAPNRELGDLFLGYERGKEKFQRPNGEWFIDDLKTSYYGWVPDNAENKWPKEIDIRTPFQEVGAIMSEMGTAIMQKIGLLTPDTSISLDNIPRLGRMLYYRKSTESNVDNPYWCGAHFDHSMFTALLPAVYFVDGQQVDEPEEAGLFVRTSSNDVWRKVKADDPDVLLFQVGEFGQLVVNDAIRATEHRVHKASGKVERYTMALFCDAPMDVVIHSTSELTSDSRYGGGKGTPCSYKRWNEETFKRFLVKD
jgi:isopenicillin N synthase-like dioxygenase